MSTQALTTKAEQGFAEHFEAVRASLPGAGNARVDKLRADAWNIYAANGLPHRRIEEWKYTDLRGLLKEAYPPAPTLGVALTEKDVSAALGGLAGVDCHRVVIVDGQLRSELSDISALGKKGQILPLSDVLAKPPKWLENALGKANPPEGDAMVALNMALLSGGAAIRVGKGTNLSKPLHIVHVLAARDAASVATRNVVVVEDGADVTLLESYVGRSTAPAQRNAVTELVTGKGATVDHVKYQNETAGTAHLTTWMTRLGADTRYRAFQFSTGAALARNQIFVRFAGEGSVSHVSGVVMGRGKQHNDTTMVIDHTVPGCESREFNKAVLDGSARGIVQCKVIVQPGAQKSDGHQMAHGLLLSETAEFDSKPELEIFADDVICGHGSTSGQIDEDLMFYLRARGIPKEEARALLIVAFIGEALEKVEDENLREAFGALASGWLRAGGK